MKREEEKGGWLDGGVLMDGWMDGWMLVFFCTKEGREECDFTQKMEGMMLFHTQKMEGM